MEILFFAISLIASAIGGICGVGGGVIIKPALDATGLLSVSAISFLSGCTVLSMSCVSFFRNRKKKGLLDIKTTTPLAIGGVLGGFLGKWLFEIIKVLLADENTVGLTQAALLLTITVGTLLYSIFSSRIKTHDVHNIVVCVLIGMGLGTISTFLGIGGGPINLTVLFFFFSMDVKKAAANSLYIILFSQLSSFMQTLFTGTIPQVDILLLILMAVGGVLGALIGGKVNSKMSASAVNRLFIGFMVFLILINIYNIVKFSIV